MRLLAQELKDSAPEVREIWEALAMEPPWLALPDETRYDFLPGVIAALVDAAVLPDDGARRRLVAAGVENGRTRRTQGFQIEDMFREYQLVRLALWRWLDRQHGGEPRSFELILGVDQAIGLCQTAALRGYHREFYEERGTWARVLEELAKGLV